MVVRANAATYRTSTFVAAGLGAGQTNQGANAIAIGAFAGQTNQGANAVAIGALAGQSSQAAGSICINATGLAVQAPNSGFYVAPIRSSNVYTSFLAYDPTTKEITSTPGLSISNVQVADASFAVIDDVAVSNSGGAYLVVNGTGFTTGLVVSIGTSPSTAATSTAYVSATRLNATIPALPVSSGTYGVTVSRIDGSSATKPLAVTVSPVPIWGTAADLGNVIQNTAFTRVLAANSDSNVVYANTTSLPPNTTVLSNGFLAGNITSVASETLYTFGINATDLELQNVIRTFSLQYYLAGLSGIILMVGEGSTHTIIAGKFNGVAKAYGFGYNYYGQLGTTTNNTTNNANPVPTNILSQGSLAGKTVLQIACGYHTVVLATDGTLHSFGWNYYGALGTATNSGTNTPNPTPVNISSQGSLSGKTISQIACGAHTAVLATDGTLHTFGYNNYGALGTATNSGTTNANPTPTNISSQGSLSGKTISKIACGDRHTIVLATDGSLHSFGWNYYGQLGTATNNGTNNANPTPVNISSQGSLSGKTISQIAAAFDWTVILATDGTIHTFGDNYYGQLGTTTNNGTSTANPTPVNISSQGSLSGKTISQITAGLGHTVVLATDGTVHTFGYNISGQLGTTTNNGSGTANPTPVNISARGSLSGKTISQIAAAGNFTIVVATDNTIHTFGDNIYGQLGTTTNNGSSTANPTPVNITANFT